MKKYFKFRRFEKGHWVLGLNCGRVDSRKFYISLSLVKINFMFQL